MSETEEKLENDLEKCRKDYFSEKEKVRN